MKPNVHICFKYFILCGTLLRLVKTDEAQDKALVDKINQKQASWKAGITSEEYPSSFMTNIYDGSRRPVALILSRRSEVPPKFDARENWRSCRDLIGAIRNQGFCNSCWAISTASVISDRICIRTKGSIKVNISSEDILTCCKKCKSIDDNCRRGGYVFNAFEYWIEVGVVTGGAIRSKDGCKPYSTRSFRKRHVDCKERCTNDAYKTSYADDKYYGKMVYKVKSSENAIQQEIIRHGPVVAAFMLFEDFQTYRSGVYQYLIGKRMGYHAIKILGWGVEKENKYWLISNSYGVKFGEQGMVKFLRGENHCQIEDFVIAGRLSKRIFHHESLALRELQEPTGTTPTPNAANNIDGNVFRPIFVKSILTNVILSMHIYYY